MQKSVLLIISGSIAAYKTLDLIRRLREHDIKITTIITKGGAEFVTSLSVATLSNGQVYGDLFSLKDESEMGHIRLSRENDLVLVIPASADIIAKMAYGFADDLASATLLATDKKVIIAPSMNTQMWAHKATKRNIATLKDDGIIIIEPEAGSLACGEIGAGRLADIDVILNIILKNLNDNNKYLAGRCAIVTSGSTKEAIDPVRYISNHSSGKQGIAIANELYQNGAEVTLITGETSEKIPSGIKVIKVESANDMLQATKENLPCDIAIFCAAVADWRAKKISPQKLKKRANQDSLTLTLEQNPDILQTIANLKKNRPELVIGFAAETESLEKNALTKLKKKNCDWIIANDVSEGKVFGKEDTNSLFLTNKIQEKWGEISKIELARKLVKKIIEKIGEK
ncbi:MAG: bifunctional phosphopantothenoylcysteine decarboxylase/phosphopantothenate--cysteine ligase CoaBC [Pseudomonadota bacterium]